LEVCLDFFYPPISRYTDNSTRWCFYVNLPCAGAAIAVLLLILRLPQNDDKAPLIQQFKRLDPLGTALFLPSTISLLLALQWGGISYLWSNWRVFLLTLFPLLLLAFLCLQIRRPDTATLPTRILTQRTIAASFLYTFASQASMLVITYYIPLFFQASKTTAPYPPAS
jgi:MFS family permease